MMTGSQLRPDIRDLVSDIQSGQVKTAALVKLLSHAHPAVIEAASLKLIQHPDWSIRKFVAQNRSGPAHILELLTADPDELVRSEARTTLHLNGASAPADAPPVTVAFPTPDKEVEPEKPTNLAEAVEQFVDRFRPHLDMIQNVLDNTPEELVTAFGRDAGWLACSFFFADDIFGQHQPDAAALQEFRRAMVPYVDHLDRMTDSELIRFFRDKGMTRHKDAPSEMLNQLLKLDEIIVKADPNEVLPRMSTLYTVGMMEVAAQALQANSAFAFIPEHVKAYAEMCMTRISEVLGTDFGDATPTSMGDRLAAVDSSTPVSTLRKLARRDDWQLRSSVASHPNLPLDLIQTLAEDENQFVRAGAACNPALPQALQFQLARDEEYLVRKALLDNERLSTAVENLLYRDDESEVREYLTAKRTDSTAKLRHLARSEDYATRRAVAVNPSTPLDTLRMLARDDEDLVRGALLKRTDIPADMLLILSRDADPSIEEEATRLLEARRLVPVERGEAQSTGQGYVYILMNASMPGILKIGRTARRSQDRVAELSSHTGVPTPFELVYERSFADCVQAERDLHARLSEHRISKDREFFKIPVYEAVNALMTLDGSA